MPSNAFKHREAWLHAVADQMRTMFAGHGATIPEKVRFFVRLPKHTSVRNSPPTDWRMLVQHGQRR